MSNSGINAARPASTPTRNDSIQIMSRANDGKDVYCEASSMTDALELARKCRNPDNSMVCILKGVYRTHRWDRYQDAQYWRKVDVDQKEVLAGSL